MDTKVAKMQHPHLGEIVMFFGGMQSLHSLVQQVDEHCAACMEEMGGFDGIFHIIDDDGYHYIVLADLEDDETAVRGFMAQVKAVKFVFASEAWETDTEDKDHRREVISVLGESVQEPAELWIRDVLEDGSLATARVMQPQGSLHLLQVGTLQ